MSIDVDYDLLSELHERVFDLFNYKHDDRNYGVMEDWRSHAQAVSQGLKFTDDCDGFAFTICELLLSSGVTPSNVMFIVCETETGEGHAVAGCTVGNKTYILENRYTSIYDWQKRDGYKWLYFMSFDDPGQWKKITNDGQT